MGLGAASWVTGPGGNFQVETTEQPKIISNLPYGRYFVTGTIENGLTVEGDTLINDSNGSIVLQFTVGAINSENLLREISVFPNPINNHSVATISNDLGGKCQFSLTNAQGTVLHQSSITLNTGINNIPLSSLMKRNYAPSVYFLFVFSGNRTKLCKFVIDK